MLSLANLLHLDLLIRHLGKQSNKGSHHASTKVLSNRWRQGPEALPGKARVVQP